MCVCVKKGENERTVSFQDHVGFYDDGLLTPGIGELQECKKKVSPAQSGNNLELKGIERYGLLLGSLLQVRSVYFIPVSLR